MYQCYSLHFVSEEWQIKATWQYGNKTINSFTAMWNIFTIAILLNAFYGISNFDKAD